MPDSGMISAPGARVYVNARRSAIMVAVGVLASAVLAAIKIISGIVGNSYALIADGVESMLDIVSGLAVAGSMKIASNPPDQRFPFGYGKVEPLATMVVATALLVAATGIAIESVRELITPHHSPAPFTLLVLVLVIAIKEVMCRALLKTGSNTRSQAVIAEAWHHRSDALTSLAAFIGISIALVAGEGYEGADDWAALFACGLILYNGVRLFRPALREMLDAAPPTEVEEQIRAVASSVEGVILIDKCRVRKSGLALFVDIHVVVDGEISVSMGHHIAHLVKDMLLATELGIMDVTVHIEPYRTDRPAEEE